MRLITFAVTLLCLASLPVVARAQQEPGAVPATPPMLDTAAFRDLGLTANQRAKIQAIHEQARRENEPLRNQIRAVLGGRSYLDLSPAERDSLRPQLDPLRQQMMENVRKVREQVIAILTPEQRHKLARAKKEKSPDSSAHGPLG
jgi:Spy/CpxP family protein refolding chaperone